MRVSFDVIRGTLMHKWSGVVCIEKHENSHTQKKETAHQKCQCIFNIVWKVDQTSQSCHMFHIILLWVKCYRKNVSTHLLAQQSWADFEAEKLYSTSILLLCKDCNSLQLEMNCDVSHMTQKKKKTQFLKFLCCFYVSKIKIPVGCLCTS